VAAAEAEDSSTEGPSPPRSRKYCVRKRGRSAMWGDGWDHRSGMYNQCDCEDCIEEYEETHHYYNRNTAHKGYCWEYLDNGECETPGCKYRHADPPDMAAVMAPLRQLQANTSNGKQVRSTTAAPAPKPKKTKAATAPVKPAPQQQVKAVASVAKFPFKPAAAPVVAVTKPVAPIIITPEKPTPVTTTRAESISSIAPRSAAAHVVVPVAGVKRSRDASFMDLTQPTQEAAPYDDVIDLC
jgi:hypothetical protein